MKYFLLITILLTAQLDSFSQDNVLKSPCDCLEKLLTRNFDKIDFQFAHEACFGEVYSRAISFTAADSAEMFITTILHQLKSNCDAYNKCHEILDKWTLERSPIRVKNREACRDVVKVGEFEDRSGAEKVIMSMRDSIQVMTFGKEGLYTKSKIEWIDDCTYKAIFIESTNPFESSILKKRG